MSILRYKKELASTHIQDRQLFLIPIQARLFDENKSIMERCEICDLKDTPYCLQMDCIPDVARSKENKHTNEKGFYFKIIPFE